MITSDFFVADSFPLSFTRYERKQYSFVCLFNTLRPIRHNLSLLLSQSVVLSRLSFGFYQYLSVSLPMNPKLHLVVRSSEFHLLKISPSAGRVWKRYFGRRSDFNSITLIESDKNVHFPHSYSVLPVFNFIQIWILEDVLVCKFILLCRSVSAVDKNWLNSWTKNLAWSSSLITFLFLSYHIKLMGYK